jgi:hypothetical protein
MYVKGPAEMQVLFYFPSRGFSAARIGNLDRFS